MEVFMASFDRSCQTEHTYLGGGNMWHGLSSLCFALFDYSIEGDYVPQPGDRVTYKETPLPPQNVHVQAVHVQIVQMDKRHEHPRWEDSEAN